MTQFSENINEPFLYHALQHMQEGYIFTNNRWIIEVFNASAAKIFEMAGTDAKGKHLLETWPEIFSPLKSKLEADAAASEYSYEVSHRHSGSGDSALEIRAYKSADGVAVFVRDIELNSSEQRFKLLVQDGSDLVTIFDQDGVYKFASPTAINVLGVGPDLLIGRNVFDFIHPDDRETARLQFKLVENEHRIMMPPFRYKHYNGEIRWMETIITNRLKDPVINGIITNSRDVTERINQEIALKKILERFNTVSKATSDAIWDLDFVTKTITWNKGLTGLFGYDLEYTSMDWWKGNVHPDDLEPVLAHFNKMIKSGIIKSRLEYRYRSADGSYKNVFDRSYIHFDESGLPTRIIGSMQDITSLKKHIAEIELQNAKLREISFIQSHQLRAPLASLMGLISLLDPETSSPEDVYEILPLLMRSAKEADDVVRAITEKASS
ncbi:PAS domain S-box protein [Pedobacter faecalis]|uniref:PAS domain S-box protein n=1 Tax=Pedobacter faecalis TaxID=3041495 RepID=UPI00254DBE3F|nr:PAS domain S-box protein [Pedobacter sp. ELA7]